MKSKSITATTCTNNGTFSKKIVVPDTKFSEAEEERMLRKFNKDTRAIEFVGGTTYIVSYNDPKGKFKSHRMLKSSSLDELLEMYRCAWKGTQVPERKCFFHKDNEKK